MRVNLLVSGLAIIAAAAVRPVSQFMLRWTDSEQFGLLSLVGGSPALQFILGFLLMDAAFYYWHRANHGLGFLWRFHSRANP